jgi:hypothetical protein
LNLHLAENICQGEFMFLFWVSWDIVEHDNSSWYSSTFVKLIHLTFLLVEN